MPFPDYTFHSGFEPQTRQKEHTSPRAIAPIQKHVRFASGWYIIETYLIATSWIVRQPDFWHIPIHRFGWVCAWSSAWSILPPPKTAQRPSMGYCMTSDHDPGVSMSPHPPQDGRWAIFVPASYKNMALGDPGLPGRRAFFTRTMAASLHPSGGQFSSCMPGSTSRKYRRANFSPLNAL
jgi:hypothetical protein